METPKTTRPPLDKLTVLQVSVRSFYERENDLASAFSYFVLQCLDSTGQSISRIAQQLEAKFKLEIPPDYISALAKRLRRLGLATYTNVQVDIKITSTGKERLDQIDEEIIKSEKNTALFVDSLQDFLKKKGISIDTEELKRELLLYFENNFSDLVPLIDAHGQSSKKIDKHAQSELYRAFEEYILHIAKTNKSNYQILKDLVHGVILSNVIKRPLSDYKRGFKNIDIYLDTNIIFSLFGLHDDLVNKATQELIESIKSIKGLKLKVFSFTKDEIINVLYGYVKNKRYMPQNIRINTIYWHLNLQKKSAQDINLFIRDLENKLNEIDIEIDYSHKADDIDEGSEEYLDLARMKGNPHPRSLAHDINAYRAIRKIRGHNEYLLESCRAFFLTADFLLYRHVTSWFKHAESKPPTIPEVLTRGYIVSMLWLKQPQQDADLPLDNLIAGVRQRAMVKNGIWDAFVREMENMESRGEITEDQVGILISSNETEEFLLEAQNQDTSGRKFETLIKKQVEKVDRNNAEKDKRSTEEAKKANQKIRELGSEVEDKEKQIQQILEAEDRRIEDVCVRKIKRIASILLSIIFAIILFPSCFLLHHLISERNTGFVSALVIFIVALFLYYLSLLADFDMRPFKIAGVEFSIPMRDVYTELRNQATQKSIARTKERSPVYLNTLSDMDKDKQQ